MIPRGYRERFENNQHTARKQTRTTRFAQTAREPRNEKKTAKSQSQNWSDRAWQDNQARLELGSQRCEETKPQVSARSRLSALHPEGMQRFIAWIRQPPRRRAMRTAFHHGTNCTRHRPVHERASGPFPSSVGRRRSKCWMPMICAAKSSINATLVPHGFF